MSFYEVIRHLTRDRSCVIDEILAADVFVPPAITEPLYTEQKLMSALEDKERDLNKLKIKVDTLLKNGHPASDKIEVRAGPFILRLQ